VLFAEVLRPRQLTDTQERSVAQYLDILSNQEIQVGWVWDGWIELCNIMSGNSSAKATSCSSPARSSSETATSDW